MSDYNCAKPTGIILEGGGGGEVLHLTPSLISVDCSKKNNDQGDDN